ncbi:MAG: nucleotidyltransferase domain-containing protein [Deltaproteobacteria bacterium]|nr:nucleotidyltransferase domain-containing protein [Deltaproteobacteria bacterium]
MFKPDEREKIRAEIIAASREDRRIVSCAITGSASVDRQDRWSDIDLAFAVRNADQMAGILKDYTDRMYGAHGALHHLDVVSGSWIYRVFFLANTLQVDLAFVPQKEFGARAPTFKLVFGAANSISHDPPMQRDVVIGWAWLYALHVRGCIRRGQGWRAEYMISGMRDQVISLCCLRHDLPERQGRGVDRLPDTLKSRLEAGLVRSLQVEELERAFSAVTDIFIEELEAPDRGLALRLTPALKELAARDAD